MRGFRRITKPATGSTVWLDVLPSTSPRNGSGCGPLGAPTTLPSLLMPCLAHKLRKRADVSRGATPLPDTVRDLEQRVRDLDRRLDELLGFVLAVALSPTGCVSDDLRRRALELTDLLTRLWRPALSSPTRPITRNAGTKMAEAREVGSCASRRWHSNDSDGRQQ
jgi:hypothetical protein